MSLLNFGITPGGAVGNELQAVTRRAVMPAVVVQIGKSDVLNASMLAAAEPVSGGVSPVTVPVQGVRMVQGAWADYSGSFAAPQVLPGLQNAEYNLDAFVVGIPYYLFEGFVQQDAEIVPIVWARMNDAGNYVSDQLSQALWAAQSANTSLMPFSVNDVISTTNPTQGNLGNIDRSANAWWRANVGDAATITGSSAAWSRVSALAAVTFAQKGAGGEPPSCGICSMGAWAAIAAEVVGNERFIVDREGAYGEAGEGVSVAFPAINIGGIPIYADLYASDDETLWMPNFNYYNTKIHQDAAFAVMGPESMLPQFQLGYIMALLILKADVCSKPSAQGLVNGFTGAFTM